MLLEIIPAVAFDTFFKLTGSKMRLLPIYRAICYNYNAYRYFLGKEWTFMDDNMRGVYEKYV